MSDPKVLTPLQLAKKNGEVYIKIVIDERHLRIRKLLRVKGWVAVNGIRESVEGPVSEDIAGLAHELIKRIIRDD